DEVQHLLTDGAVESPLERALRAKLTPWLQGPRPEPIRPLHWALEFPEVMRNGGFDAVVGNPPFLGGQRLTGRIGEDLREYLIQRIGRDKRGSADLCAYFLLRNLSLAPHGRVGIIATNTIAQGDTREVGLDQPVDMGWMIYRAEKSQPWPGTAALEVALVWTGHPGSHEARLLDGNRVLGITPSLVPPSRIRGNPYRLAANAGQSSQGSIVLGTGFILEQDEAQALIAKDPRNKEVLYPYLNGEDLNSRWDCSESRWVINFHDWPRRRAESYVELFDRVLRLVKPERDANSYSKHARDNWWLYERIRPELYAAIADFQRVLAIARVSKTGLPQLITTQQVMGEQVVIFVTESSAALTLLSSSIHFFWWTTKGESTLETRLRYTPSDGFETYPRPRLTVRMTQVGQQLDDLRSKSMEGRKAGLTALYNLIDNNGSHDEDIVRLREIHVEIDEAAREAYALDEERERGIREFEVKVASAPLPVWREIELGHGFHETRQGVRFTISPQARVDVLDKLLALNHYRYRQEVEQGLHSGKGRGASKKKAAGEPTTAASMFDDGALFRPEGAMF